MSKAELKDIVIQIVRTAPPGSNMETVERASLYAINRILEGTITTEWEVKLCWSSFADGFCTAKGHVGSGHTG